MRAVVFWIGIAAALLPSVATAARHAPHRRPAVRVVTGTVVFHNARPETVQVVVAGHVLGTVVPGGSLQLAVAPGPFTLQARTLAGAVVHTETVSLGAASVHEVRAAVRPGVVRVRNDSGVALALYVGRQEVATLLPGERERVVLSPGSHRLRAVYTQHGQERTLRSRRMTVREGEEHALRLRPDDAALVAVDNALPVPAMLLVSGEPMGMMMPGETLLFELPVGTVDLAMLSRGRLLDAARVAVAPHLPSHWVAQVPGPGQGPRRAGVPSIGVRPQAVVVPLHRGRPHAHRVRGDGIDRASAQVCWMDC